MNLSNDQQVAVTDNQTYVSIWIMQHCIWTIYNIAYEPVLQNKNKTKFKNLSLRKPLDLHINLQKNTEIHI